MKKIYSIFLILFCVVLSLTFFGCGQVVETPSTGPIFTNPAVKLAELADPSFTLKLYYEAIALEPMLASTGTQVHTGYWSVYANRGRLVVQLDAINNYSSTETHRAIWDEGTTTSTAKQYPSYITMNKEYWYERAYPLSDGTVSIEGVHYTDPHPVTTQEADDIWGAYSQRYADMAKLIRQATGITIESWCFVQGARANRVFYKYELPKLVSLEATGDVYVHFATTYEASWLNPAQWITGTTNTPTPEP